MTNNVPSRRRWFRFSLRTLLVLVTLVCLSLGYMAWAKNWIRQRHEALKAHESNIHDRGEEIDDLDFANALVYFSSFHTAYEAETWSHDPYVLIFFHGAAPFPLNWLGEPGVRSLCFAYTSTEEMKRLGGLFPEARVLKLEKVSGEFGFVEQEFE